MECLKPFNHDFVASWYSSFHALCLYSYRGKNFSPLQNEGKSQSITSNPKPIIKHTSSQLLKETWRDRTRGCYGVHERDRRGSLVVGRCRREREWRGFSCVVQEGLERIIGLWAVEGWDRDITSGKDRLGSAEREETGTWGDVPNDMQRGVYRGGWSRNRC